MEASAGKRNLVNSNEFIKSKRKWNGQLTSNTSKMSKKQLYLENQKEEALILKLGKNLKLRNSTSKAMCDDGLDYLLESCDRISMATTEKNVTQESGQKSANLKRKQNAENELQSESKSKLKPCPTKVLNNWTVSNSRQGYLSSESFRNNNDSTLKKNIEHSNKEVIVSQDPGYSSSEPLEDNNGSPSKKQKLKESEEENEKCLPTFELENSASDNPMLKRQIKGLMNRLAENNMAKIVIQLEDLYRSNARNDLNKILIEVVMFSIVSPVRTPERLIQETAMLIAILNSNVDAFLGIHVIYTAVKHFHSLYLENADNDCKKMDNLLLFIAHLYNFKVINDVLMYDILNLLTVKFNEKCVELILIILRSVGIALRKDNSILLKELILKLQGKASALQESGNGSRMKYLLDVVLAIKNNNIQKIPSYDPDHLEHLKKLLKGFLHSERSEAQLKLCLDDILRAEKEGHLLQSIASGQMSLKTSNNLPVNLTDSQSSTLNKLMKKYRMNTDTRRYIFSILLTAEDYLQAFEMIIRLDLKDNHESEIMSLILHCANKAKTYNPFFHFLACKLCSYNRKYLIALQYSVWDKLEGIDTFKRNRVSNFAKFVSNCIIEKGLSLSVLKVLDFSKMSIHMDIFVKEVMLDIFNNSSQDTFEFVCKRITSPKLAIFRESIWLFIKHILYSSKSKEKYCNTALLKQRLQVMSKIFNLNNEITQT